MDEIDLAAAEPKLLVGWSLKEGVQGGLIVYLEYADLSGGCGSPTLAIPSEPIPSFAEELARRGAPH